MSVGFQVESPSRKRGRERERVEQGRQLRSLSPTALCVSVSAMKEPRPTPSCMFVQELANIDRQTERTPSTVQQEVEGMWRERLTRGGSKESACQPRAFKRGSSGRGSRGREREKMFLFLRLSRFQSRRQSVLLFFLTRLSLHSTASVAAAPATMPTVGSKSRIECVFNCCIAMDVVSCSFL